GMSPRCTASSSRLRSSRMPATSLTIHRRIHDRTSGDLGDDESKFPGARARKCVHMLDPDVGRASDTLHGLAGELRFIVFGITLPPNNADDDLARTKLDDLGLLYVHHVLEDVVHPPDARAASEDDVVFESSVDAFYDSPGATAWA